MHASEFTARVGQIADISSLMLAAARDANWPQLEALRARAVRMIGDLQASPIDGGLASDERHQKLLAMRRILSNDGQIRDLAEPWLRDLNALLQPHAASAEMRERRQT